MNRTSAQAVVCIPFLDILMFGSPKKERLQ
jgi:hypothetical protein